MATCTRPPSLTAPAKVDCAVHFGQIVRFAYRRRIKTKAFATVAAMKTLAAWNAALTATDETKIILTPIFTSFIIPGSEAQFAGENDNSSVNGMGYLTGYNAVKPTGQYVGLPGDIKATLELLEEESRAELGTAPMELWGITPDNRIISVAENGIPFANYFIGSVDSQGFKALNLNTFGFSLDGKWDKGVTITQADFDLVSTYAEVVG